jgi:DNA modification methylase
LNEIRIGDCLQIMKLLVIGNVKVQTCVTSPPYFGLRDYGTATWEGGDPKCDHEAAKVPASHRFDYPISEKQSSNGGSAGQGKWIQECPACGAVRVDSQIGLEETPGKYVERLVEVFRLVRELLADDGTLWLNLGDSYNAYNGNRGPAAGANKNNHEIMPDLPAGNGLTVKSLKPKDLIGIPWRVAFALQQPYEHVAIKERVDRAWLAGLVDGEGCLSILETRSPHGSGNSYPPILQIRMCDPECIDRAKSVTGFVESSILQHPPSQGGVRGSYQWRLHGEKAAQITAEIFPYLCIKRRQAVILWNHQQIRNSYETKRGVQIPDDAVQKQKECRRLIRTLNQKKSVDVPSWMETPSVKVDPGWYLRSDVIWHKPNPMPESVTDRPTKSHEYIFLLSKSADYFYDIDAIREPHLEESIKRAATPWNGNGIRNHPSGRGQLVSGGRAEGAPMNTCHPNGRNKRSVWTVCTQPYDGAHFATFPPDLILPCVLAGSRPGDVVFDPFMGSGTTALVAKENGRRYLGCELNPEYKALQDERLAQEVLFGGGR